MLNSYIKITLLCSFFFLTNDAYSQEAHFKTQIKALDVGVYDYSKVKKKSYKIFYNQEADQEFEKILMEDDGFNEIFGVFEAVDSVGNKVICRENEAFEYCPKLGYIIITGGHGYIFVYDIKTKKEICSNPSTYVYSPSKKYRFSSLQNDGIQYFLEEKVGDEYICHHIYFSSNIHGVYWVNEETFYYLRDRQKDDGTTYQMAYSFTIQPKTAGK